MTLAEIERRDATLQAFTALAREPVPVSVGPLAGMPIGVKDVIDVAGLPTSYGSDAFDPYVARTDATAVARLRAAGAHVVGKTRTSELAWLPDTPPTVNPLDPALLVGGSSGGSAAAVAAGLVRAALGTDAGGSIRWPAAMCGCVGVRPTYGAVSVAGTLPCSWSLDVVGPLARTVADARLVLAALVGHDPADPVSAPAARLESLRTRLASPGRLSARGARIGVLEEPLFAVEDERTQSHLDRLLRALAVEGAAIVRTRLPVVRFAPATIFAISLAEGVALTERLRLHADRLTEDVRRPLHVAHAIPAVLVARAHQARRVLQRAVAALFREHALDALALPASIGPAPRRGDPGPAVERASEVSYLASLTGQPALTLPLAAEGDPVSVQLVGRPFEDDRLLDLAAAAEALTPARSG